MDYREIIGSKFSEPAAVILYKEGDFRILEVNDGYIPELWMNVSLEEYIKKYPGECFDEENLNIFTDAVKRCVSSTTSEDVIVETWRQVFSDCCGYDKVCLKSRLILIEKTEEGAVLYEGIRNISNEKRAQDTLEDIEYRYKNASEQINIYNWEYDIRTKEMRPCYRLSQTIPNRRSMPESFLRTMLTCIADSWEKSTGAKRTWKSTYRLRLDVFRSVSNIQPSLTRKETPSRLSARQPLYPIPNWER